MSPLRVSLFQISLVNADPSLRACCGTTLLIADGELASGRRPGPVGRAQKAFERVSELPWRQQAKIIELVEALVDQHRRKAS